MAIVYGSDAPETIEARGVTNNADVVYAYGGLDHVFGHDGNDTIYGGEGDDVLHGQNDNDILKGGGGADHLYGGDGIDTASYVDSPEGVFIYLTARRGYYGDADGDVLEGVENVNGSAYFDLLEGDARGNTLVGLNGHDSLSGRGGADTLNGGNGFDNANYYNSPAAVQVSLMTGRGTGGDAEGDTLISIEDLIGSQRYGDVLVGNSDVNLLRGSGGDDTLNGGGGADRMEGGTESDVYYVDNAADEIIELAGEGMDTVRASTSYVLPAAADVETFAATDDIGTAALSLTGNETGNVVRGNNGNNTINGGHGNDELTGRGGMDLFLFDTPLDVMFNVDVITDFNVVDDTIRLDATIFSSGLTVGSSVGGSQFVVGAAALDAGDRIIYNNATGDVFYDSDGTGPTAAIRFARLSAGLADPTDLDPLTNFDFFVIA